MTVACPVCGTTITADTATATCPECGETVATQLPVIPPSVKRLPIAKPIRRKYTIWPLAVVVIAIASAIAVTAVSFVWRDRDHRANAELNARAEANKQKIAEQERQAKAMIAEDPAANIHTAVYPYVHFASKSEDKRYRTVMEIYTFSGGVDADNLLGFCKQKKREVSNRGFFFLGRTD